MKTTLMEQDINWTASNCPENMNHWGRASKKQWWSFSIVQFYEHQMDKMTCGETFIMLCAIKGNTKPLTLTCMLSLFLRHRAPIEGKYKFWQTRWLPWKQWTPSWHVNNTPRDHVNLFQLINDYNKKVRKFPSEDTHTQSWQQLCFHEAAGSS